jgi:hypothetical protein
MAPGLARAWVLWVELAVSGPVEALKSPPRVAIPFGPPSPGVD